jgi:hypothetical protein
MAVFRKSRLSIAPSRGTELASAAAIVCAITTFSKRQ